MLRYALARKPLPTEEGEETQLGPTLLYVATEPGTGSPDTEMLLNLSLPFHRQADVWAQTLVNNWNATGNTNMEQFRDWIVATYGSEYFITLQGSGDAELSP